MLKLNTDSPKVYTYEAHSFLTMQKVCYHLGSEFPKNNIN